MSDRILTASDASLVPKEMAPQGMKNILYSLDDHNQGDTAELHMAVLPFLEEMRRRCSL